MIRTLPLSSSRPSRSLASAIWIPVPRRAGHRASPFDSSDSQSPGRFEIAHYQFDFGDGSATIDQAQPLLALHTYSEEGVYAVQLTVVDLLGNSATVSGQLTIRDDPPACTDDSDSDPGERCNAVCFQGFPRATRNEHRPSRENPARPLFAARHRAGALDHRARVHPRSAARIRSASSVRSARSRRASSTSRSPSTATIQASATTRTAAPTRASTPRCR